MTRRLSIVTFLVWASFAASVQACTVVVGDNWVDPRITVARDCSFSEAGNRIDVNWAGGPAKDLGQGRVGQRLINYTGCDSIEHLMVADCQSLETIQIEGRPEAGQEGVIPAFYTVDRLYPPHGKVDLQKRPDIAQLRRIAQSQGYVHRGDVLAWSAKLGKRNAFDPYCGCAIHYPDTKGARP